jgi:hypothetical protein
MKRLADYAFTINKNDRFIFIEDKNLGNISLTNSIEDVISDIEQKELVDLNSYVVIQKDSEHEYSQVTLKNNRPVWRHVGLDELSFLKEKYKV